MIEVGEVLTTVQSELMGVIADALPVAGTVFAALAGVYLAFKFFKRITGARS